MAYQNPSVADFKSYFFRDFPFGIDPNVAVLDQDIVNAMLQTNASINQALFSEQGSYSVGYNLLTAHYMTLNLRSSSQGINGQFNFLEASKGVGGVNSSYSIPQRILDNPYWSMLVKTNYGAQYLQMVLPLLEGAMFSVMGAGLIPRQASDGGGLWGWSI